MRSAALTEDKQTAPKAKKSVVGAADAAAPPDRSQGAAKRTPSTTATAMNTALAVYERASRYSGRCELYDHQCMNLYQDIVAGVNCMIGYSGRCELYDQV